ncbi:MAG: FAD-dependent oxidoreductase [Candidatus Sericytochromatia bacterium]
MQKKSILKKTLYSLSLTSLITFSTVFNVNAEPFPDNSYSDVIVVGGGLSGLTTAYKLKQAGISCRVLELSPRVGGRARTAKYDNNAIVEAGLAEFWETNPAFQLIKELKLPYRESLTYSSIMIDKKLYPFTQSTNDDFLRYLFNKNEYSNLQSWNKQMEKYYHQVKSKKMDKYLLSLQDISFADWINKTKLSKKTKEWIRISLQVEIGTEWDKICFRWNSRMAYIFR